MGIGVLLLVLGGISVLSLSEQEEVENMAASDFREENEYTDTEKDSNGQRRAVRVYDTALYLRARPPTDPFHASEVLPGETTMETAGSEETPAGGNAGRPKYRRNLYIRQRKKFPGWPVCYPWERISGPY